MTRALQLLPLVCPTCGSDIAAGGEDVVFYCTSCRNGWRLDPRFEAGERAADGGPGGAPLAPVEVTFPTVPGVLVERWRPFWQLRGEVLIRERRTSGGIQLGFLTSAALTGGPDGEADVSSALFRVPAFEAPLSEVLRLAQAHTSFADWDPSPPPGDRLGERLTGAVHPAEDAERLARYLVLLREVARPDSLRSLDLEVRFEEPELYAAPFVRRGEAWVSALA